MQLHEEPTASGESWKTPPVQIYHDDGALVFYERVGDAVRTKMPAPRDRWIRMLVHAKWSRGSDGLFEVWQDGRQVATHRGATTNGYRQGPFLSLGIYMGPGNFLDADASIYFDNVSVTRQRPAA